MERLSDACTPERFLRDVANHTMEVRMDNGLYKHLTFSNNGSCNGRFHLVTWPGWLTICGDYGTFVFSRIPDMFEFFRTDRRHDDLRRCINPGYWGQKCEARDRSGMEEFNRDYFLCRVLEDLKEFLKETRADTTQTERNQLWKVVHETILMEDDPQRAAWEFRHLVNSRVGEFTFQDLLYESSFTTFTFHYLWCCYAIAWGIQQYDKTKEAENANHL